MSEALKKLLKGRPTDEEVGSIFFEMGEDGARGSILAGTSFLEDVLKGAIMHRFGHLNAKELKDLFDGTAPLSTFSAKIKIAYAMGVIGKLTRHDLEKMRELRNAAAHSARHITFKIPEIANMVLGLHSLKDVVGGEKFIVQHKFVSCVNLIMLALVAKMNTPPFTVQGIKNLD
jgi:hypothetical protein